MRYAQIRTLDISNGEDIGIALFVQGCHFHCKNCFNTETWDFDGGQEWTKEIQQRFIEYANKPYIRRISILGGEPLAPENINDVIELLKILPNKKVWLYTGYNYENIINKEILNYIDVLVDGQYEDNNRNLRLKFKGSTNQRVIDIKKSLETNTVVLWEAN